MFAYIVRRVLYAIPILIGVNLLTFTLFFVVNSPDDRPLFLNPQAEGLSLVTDTIFFTKSVKLFAFDFGRSESGRDITTDVSTRMWPSLAVALPTFIVGIWVNICVALLGIGSGARWYRTLFLEEANQDYVRTARAKGASEISILFRHILPNAMIPILTGVVVLIPSLFMGSLLIESFFGIPGLGSYMLDAIKSQDFAIVRSMVFIGSILYIVGLILTDISYTWADPRVRLN